MVSVEKTPHLYTITLSKEILVGRLSRMAFTPPTFPFADDQCDVARTQFLGLTE
jgi:hypothetical protein